MEALTTTLESARKLKAAGFPQGTMLYWLKMVHQDWRVGQDKYSASNRLAAPTAQELADQLQGNIKLYRSKRWFAVDAALKSDIAQNVGEADTMVEALAALWLASREVQQ